MISLYRQLSIIIYLWGLDLVDALQIPSASASNINVDDFRNFFKPTYFKVTGTLSPTKVVSMMPSIADDTTSPKVGPFRQNLFTSPIVSALYERVLPPLWASGLRIGGPDAEYESAARHLVGNGEGLALDLSCGTGFVGRRIASSKKFRHVFALDYSQEMLGECLRSIEREGETNLSISLIRGDAGYLPFRDEVLDAVHWGAAMHCVPDAERAMKEVYRILKPGGRLYATTFLRPFPDVVFRFFTVGELEKLSRGAGFGSEKLEVEGRGVYGIIRATK